MKVLKNRLGMSYIQTCVGVLVLALFLWTVLTYASIMTIVQRSQEDNQRVLDSFVTQKSIEIYDSIKRGSNRLETGDFTADYVPQLLTETALAKFDSTVYHIGESGNILCQYQDFSVVQDGDTLKLKLVYELTYPVVLLGQETATIRIPLRVTSALVLK